MKKRYITKEAMAIDLSKKLGVSFETAKSQLSRKPLPLIEFQEIEIEGEVHSIKFHLTPEIKMTFKLK